MCAWKKYQAEIEALTKRLGKIICKRESHMMTQDDPVLAETLAQEMRTVMDEIIKSQEKYLTEIQRDLMQLLDVLKEMFDHKPPVVNPDMSEQDKIDPYKLRMEKHPHDLVRKS